MVAPARTALVLLSFLSLQLSLFGGGVDCAFAGALSHMGVGEKSAPVAMAGMDMAGGAMSTMHEAKVHVGGETGRNDVPCDDEHQAAGCDSMSVCVFAAVTAPPSAVGGAMPPPAGVPAAVAVTPPAERAAPDIPPPRA